MADNKKVGGEGICEEQQTTSNIQPLAGEGERRQAAASNDIIDDHTVQDDKGGQRKTECWARED